MDCMYYAGAGWHGATRPALTAPVRQIQAFTLASMHIPIHIHETTYRRNCSRSWQFFQPLPTCIQVDD